MSKTFFTSDTHFGHENIMKYCLRTKFMNDQERELMAKSERGEIDQRAVRVSMDSIERMNTAMIDNINAVVGVNDVLYHIGDVFWGHDFDVAKAIRNRIKCKTIHHILGNHDEPEILNLFTTSEKYAEIIVEMQKIFLCHYPMRTWDKSHKGSWCLYGHVHAQLWEEDKYGLSPANRTSLENAFSNTIAEYVQPWSLQIQPSVIQTLASKLVQNVADHNCHMLTLDVGVDAHDFRPWSMDELRQELHPKIEAWRLRNEREKANRKRNTCKSN